MHITLIKRTEGFNGRTWTSSKYTKVIEIPFMPTVGMRLHTTDDEYMTVKEVIWHQSNGAITVEVGGMIKYDRWAQVDWFTDEPIAK